MGGAAQMVWRGQPRRRGDDVRHLLVAIDVGPRPPPGFRDQVLRRDFGAWVQALQPARKSAHMSEPTEPGLPARRPRLAGFPTQEQLRGHMPGTLVHREGGKVPQDMNGAGRQAGPKGFPLEEVLLHALSDRDHRTASRTGHERASGRNAS